MLSPFAATIDAAITAAVAIAVAATIIEAASAVIKADSLAVVVATAFTIAVAITFAAAVACHCHCHQSFPPSGLLLLILLPWHHLCRLSLAIAADIAAADAVKVLTVIHQPTSEPAMNPFMTSATW